MGLIQKNKINKAFSTLLSEVADNPSLKDVKKEIVHLSSNYRKNEIDIATGCIKDDDYKVREARIIKGLITVVSQLESKLEEKEKNQSRYLRGWGSFVKIGLGILGFSILIVIGIRFYYLKEYRTIDNKEFEHPNKTFVIEVRGDYGKISLVKEGELCLKHNNNTSCFIVDKKGNTRRRQ